MYVLKLILGPIGSLGFLGYGMLINSIFGFLVPVSAEVINFNRMSLKKKPNFQLNFRWVYFG